LHVVLHHKFAMEYEVPNFPDVLVVAAPAFVALLAIEWWLVARKRIGGRYVTKDAVTSMSMGFGQLVSDILMGAISRFGNFVSLIGALVFGRF